MNDFYLHGFGMGFGWLILILIVFFLYYLFNNNYNNCSKTSARDILDKRYANGEIDEAEYKKKKDDLKL